MKEDVLYNEGQTLKMEESCLPLLQSGKYELTAQVSTDLLGDGEEIKESFYMEGPGFWFGDDEIASVYPPSGMTGDFAAALPQVVFHRKTLPWEKEIEEVKTLRCAALQDTTAQKSEPWIALLTLYEGEEPELTTGRLGDVSGGAKGVFFPKGDYLPGELEEECHYMDLDAKLFCSVVPDPEELVYLCHARQIQGGSTDSEEAEWVSLLFGSRLPRTSAEGEKNHCYLISLEGFGKDYRNLAQKGYEKVRLLVLYHWEFYSRHSGRTLYEVMKGLSGGRFQADMAKSDQTYIPNGYYPLRHQFRNGSQSVSLYRGPLVPEKREAKRERAYSADQLYSYISEKGVFDVSYAAAWQLGILLALNQQSVAEEIMKVKKKNKQKAMRSRQKEVLKDKLYQDFQSDGPVEQVLQMMEEIRREES